jgi:hypothetical protein
MLVNIGSKVKVLSGVAKDLTGVVRAHTAVGQDVKVTGQSDQHVVDLDSPTTQTGPYVYCNYDEIQAL